MESAAGARPQRRTLERKVPGAPKVILLMPCSFS
jgi:hypothetical protein